MTPLLSCGLASTAAVATPVPASSTADMLPIRMALLLILIGYGTRIASGQVYLQRLGVMTRLTG